MVNIAKKCDSDALIVCDVFSSKLSPDDETLSLDQFGPALLQKQFETSRPIYTSVVRSSTLKLEVGPVLAALAYVEEDDEDYQRKKAKPTVTTTTSSSSSSSSSAMVASSSNAPPSSKKQRR
jgi:hypothetical protein